MPSFRSSKSQAEHAVSQKISIGKSRHVNRNDGRIHSLGTARGYEQELKGFAEHLRLNQLGDLHHATIKDAQQYLAERSEKVGQKTLDLSRQAIQMHLGIRLEVVKSSKETALSTRSYTAVQVARIASAQSERNGMATQIAYCAGLRAHELLSLSPLHERQASAHRQWSSHRFEGRDGVRYTVVGKGGLVREVLISKELADRLEKHRLETPCRVIDRGVYYIQKYDIGGGRSWSQSFSAASKRQLGFSNGAHGLRHSYVQSRMKELMLRGNFFDEAKQTVAQEVGHFDQDTTEVYLR